MPDFTPGKTFHLAICNGGIPIFDDDGTFRGYRGTGRDITGEVQAEAELRAAKGRAGIKCCSCLWLTG